MSIASPWKAANAAPIPVAPFVLSGTLVTDSLLAALIAKGERVASARSSAKMKVVRKQYALIALMMESPISGIATFAVGPIVHTVGWEIAR